MSAFLLAAAEAATALVTSQWELRKSHWECGKSHSELSAGEWDFQIAARKASGRTGGAARSTHWDPRLWRGALAGSHSPRREAPSACSHWEAAPLEPCARHFLRGTFLSKIDLNLA